MGDGPHNLHVLATSRRRTSHVLREQPPGGLPQEAALPPAETVHRFFEYTTGMDPHQSVGIDMVLDGFADRVVGHSARLGRRSRDLRLPVDWAAQGMYEARKVDGFGVAIKNKWTNQVAIVKETKDLPSLEHISIALELTWSEHRAIVHREIAISKVCIPLTGMSSEYALVMQQKRLRSGRRAAGIDSNSCSSATCTSATGPSASFVAMRGGAKRRLELQGPAMPQLTDGDLKTPKKART